MMKKTFIGATLALFLTLLCLTACQEDDGVMERPDYTSVKYKLVLSSDLLRYYDVTAVYNTLDGHTDSTRVDQEYWEYKEKKDGEHRNGFLFRAYATLKDPVPALLRNVDEYELKAEYGHETYTKKTSATNTGANEVLNIKVKKESIETYVTSHSVISICHFKAN
jgi:hypothetical protein